MDCRAFYKWLEERDLYDVSEADQALRHAEKCPECRELYCKDETLDSKLCQEFSRIPLPVKLKNRIDLDLDRQSIRKTKSSW
ncbi:MAG: hypothetical protein GY702_15610, partial [Desulfobulbaceae bacterium]|nr:hypothetical protein [Desulfobulbaceae bacterium]